jgi:hypothetical protein
MAFRAYGVAVLSAVGTLWLTSGTQREKALLVANEPQSVGMRALEARVAALPSDVAAIRALVQAYLDARQPGLALVLVDGATRSAREDLGVQHAYARALVDEGRNEDALAVEKRVVAGCRVRLVERTATASGCNPVVLASAMRRADILGELVALGVEDSPAHPEETLIAYQNATREARVIAQ